MFADYVYEQSPAAYATSILIDDVDGLNKRTDFIKAFAAHGFEVIEYMDDLSFRINHERKLKSNAKTVVLKTRRVYIPYDICKKFTFYVPSLRSLFPKLNMDVLQNLSKIDLDLLSAVIGSNYDDLNSKAQTETYIRQIAYDSENVAAFLQLRLNLLLEKSGKIESYADWFEIAESKAEIDVLAAKYGAHIDTNTLNNAFQAYALEQYGKLSSKVDTRTPILVSRVMEYIHESSKRFVIVVMDGMSEFDWKLISESFSGIPYEQTAVFAMIPSTTSVSRQCLLSNKYPKQLISPWNQSKEESEFYECAKAMGYKETEIGYERGYDADFGSFTQCGAVIINDVDVLVHAQTQGRLGMLIGISGLFKEGKLSSLVKRLLGDGFDVYITADHGNTLCTGLGKYVGAGVDVETKSHRMLVLKNYADKVKLVEKYDLVEYPKYYLPKEFDYLICDGAYSLDAKGNQVMTHGGMTLDEVVVPFIKIKAGDYNG